MVDSADRSRATLLVVEDDLALRSLYARTFERLGLRVLTAAGALDARSILQGTRPDAVIVDVGLEDDSGLSLLPQLAAGTLVVVATGYRDTALVQRVLADGVDDVVFKPFAMEELGARVLGRLAARRSGEGQGKLPPPCLQYVPGAGSILCTRRDQRVGLSGSEARALTLLVEADGSVVSREALAQAVHGESWDPSSRRVDALVSRLRRKLACERCSVERDLSTVHSLGYRFAGADRTAPVRTAAGDDALRTGSGGAPEAPSTAPGAPGPDPTRSADR